MEAKELIKKLPLHKKCLSSKDERKLNEFNNFVQTIEDDDFKFGSTISTPDETPQDYSVIAEEDGEDNLPIKLYEKRDWLKNQREIS